MTRAEIIAQIKKAYPGLYEELEKRVPDLLADPDNATEDDIAEYNAFVCLHSAIIFDMRF